MPKTKHVEWEKTKNQIIFQGAQEREGGGKPERKTGNLKYQVHLGSFKYNLTYIRYVIPQ